jgi:predicted amino acid dehydrogenase
MGIDARGATVAVVGATGSIGAACVELIAPHVREIILVARNQTRLRKLHAELGPRLACRSSFSLEISAAVRRADLILTATSSTQDVIEPEDLRTGAVVCELSLPHDVSRRVAAERPDVLVVEGGNMRAPGNLRAMRVREAGRPFDLNLPRGTLLACMSETALLALSNRREPFTLGRGIDIAKVREIEALADDAGFELADMRAFDTAITREAVAAVRAAAARRRNLAS